LLSRRLMAQPDPQQITLAPQMLAEQAGRIANIPADHGVNDRLDELKRPFGRVGRPLERAPAHYAAAAGADHAAAKPPHGFVS
jgi:hypothetical protein